MIPNLFLAGAPKCGTTSLYSWLSGHRAIFAPHIKEPHFLAVLRPDRVIERWDDYAALYADPGPAQYAMDGSTTYLHTPGAMEAARALSPNARVILCVRDPIEMTRSLHAYKVSRLQDDVEDFERAWHLSFERRRGESLPSGSDADPYQLDYAEMGLLGKVVSHAVRLFGERQVHVMLFDELIRCPKCAYQEVLEFLGLENDGRTSFEPQNVTRRSGVTQSVYGVAKRLPRPMLQFLRRHGVGSLAIVDKLSPPAARAQRPALNPEFERELRAFYNEDVRLLQSVIGRDLSAWR